MKGALAVASQVCRNSCATGRGAWAILPPNGRCLVSYPGYPADIFQVAGAPGSLSMTYLPFETDMIGTPGTFRILLLRSRSFAVYRVRGVQWDKNGTNILATM
jgi:hypothetical protein